MGDNLRRRFKKFIYIYGNYYYLRAENDLKKHLSAVETWSEFLKNLDKKNIIMAPFCGEKDCEEKIKKDSARFEA